MSLKRRLGIIISIVGLASILTNSANSIPSDYTPPDVKVDYYKTQYPHIRRTISQMGDYQGHYKVDYDTEYRVVVPRGYNLTRFSYELTTLTGLGVSVSDILKQKQNEDLRENPDFIREGWQIYWIRTPTGGLK